MRSNDDAFSQHSTTLAFESLADDVFPTEIGDSILNSSLLVGSALVSVAVLRKIGNAEPDEAFAIIFCVEFEIANDFAENASEMVLVIAHCF